MYALGYGTVYRIFPVNGTPIGICPSMDFWMFPYLRKQADLNIAELDDVIERLSWKVLKRAPSSTNASALINDLEEIGAVSPIIRQIAELLDPTSNQISVASVGSELPAGREVWFDGKAISVLERETWIMGLREF